MKILLANLLFLLMLSASGSSLAYNQWSNGGCDSGDCGDSYCSECQCTDPGYGRNTCMSNGEYCEKYGNIGGR